MPHEDLWSHLITALVRLEFWSSVSSFAGAFDHWCPLKSKLTSNLTFFIYFEKRVATIRLWVRRSCSSLTSALNADNLSPISRTSRLIFHLLRIAGFPSFFCCLSENILLISELVNVTLTPSCEGLYLHICNMYIRIITAVECIKVKSAELGNNSPDSRRLKPNFWKKIYF